MIAPLQVRHIDAAFMLLGDAFVAPSFEERRAALVDLFEQDAEWHDDILWIPVERAADMILEHPTGLWPATTPSN